jgi:glutaredoxin/glutathione-dependent peroxiredoxin
MPIKVGDRLPNVTFRVMSADGPKTKTAHELFDGKKSVLFAVPGAFTPTCHKNHLPGFIKNSAAIKAKGIDQIAVTSVNDVFVMDAWMKASGADGAIDYFLADGNADFAKAVGFDVDGTDAGRGIRSKRYSMIIEDCTVKSLNIEEVAGKAEISGAENLLKQL